MSDPERHPARRRDARAAIATMLLIAAITLAGCGRLAADHGGDRPATTTGPSAVAPSDAASGAATAGLVTTSPSGDPGADATTAPATVSTDRATDLLGAVDGAMSQIDDGVADFDTTSASEGE